MPQKFRVQTYAEADDDGDWYCHVDLGSIAAQLGPISLEQVEGIRVGPWPSRQVARRELRGPFRELVMSALKEFLRKSGGSIQSFEINERPREDTN